MTDSAHPHIRLGIIKVLAESLSLFFRRFPLFFLIAVVPSVLLSMIGGWVNPPQIATAPPQGMSVLWQYDTAPELAVLLLNAIVYLLVMGVTILAAYDSLLGKPVKIAAYLRRCLTALPAIAVLGLAFYLLMLVGFLFLVLPGLYVAARYAVFVPAILVDRAGFSGLGRAAALSRGYRWPILGGFLLLILVYVGVSILIGLLIGVIGGMLGMYTFIMVEAVTSAVVNAFSAVFTALLYARLREIKEGLGIRDLAEVFA